MASPCSRRAISIALVSSGLHLSVARVRAEQPVRIAAAASFRQAVDDIIAAYQKQTGQKMLPTYGATGNLVNQIQQGAPFDLFLAADEESTARIASAGLAAGAPELLVRGGISLITPRASPLAFSGSFRVTPTAGGPTPGGQQLRAAFEAGQIRRFAIGNPELAPYGKAAREALENLGLLQLAAPRFVFGENVGQVAQYVASGAAEAGITATALTKAEPLASALTGVELPQSLHAPINQTFIVLKRAGAGAAAFRAFLKGADARAIFERHGFVTP